MGRVLCPVSCVERTVAEFERVMAERASANCTTAKGGGVEWVGANTRVIPPPLLAPLLDPAPLDRRTTSSSTSSHTTQPLPPGRLLHSNYTVPLDDPRHCP